MSAALEQLARLRQHGFAFTSIPDRDGRLDRLLGVCQRGSCIDAVMVYSEGEAVAWRTRDQDEVLRPDSVLWSRTGPVAEVASALLELPAPGQRLAPTLERRAPLGLWLPRSG